MHDESAPLISGVKHSLREQPSSEISRIRHSFVSGKPPHAAHVGRSQCYEQ